MLVWACTSRPTLSYNVCVTLSRVSLVGFCFWVHFLRYISLNEMLSTEKRGSEDQRRDSQRMDCCDTVVFTHTLSLFALFSQQWAEQGRERERVFLSVIKPFCGENSFWLAGPGSPVGGPGSPSGWAYALPGPPHSCAPVESCEIHRLGPNEFISLYEL